MAKQNLNTQQQANSNRQNDTTNTATKPRIEYGWGVITNNTGGNSIIETVTFQTAFATPPIVTVTSGGDHPSSTTYGSGGVLLAAGIVSQATNLTTTSFQVLLAKRDSTNFAAGYSFYQWMAIGV